MNRISAFYLLIAIGLASCKKDKKDDPIIVPVPDQLEAHMVPKLDGQNYIVDQIITSSQGYRYYFSEIKILGTDMANGSSVLSDSYLFSFQQNGTGIKSVVGNKIDFSNLSLNIGVPNALNHADPSVPASTSALNISNAGDMHWGWNPGYIFVKLEGKVDTTDNGIDDFDHNFLFHLGMDPLFRTLSFNGINWSASGVSKYRTNLNLFVKEIFDKSGDEVDLRVDYISHSLNNQMVLSNKIMDNLVNSIEKE